MTTKYSILRALYLILWTVAGLSGCGADASVRDPDIDDCPARRYRVTSVEIPLSAWDAIDSSFDLDGDGVRDNWLGFANALVHAWSPTFAVAERVDARLASALDWELVVHQCERGGPASAGVGPPDDESIETARTVRMPGGEPLTGGTFAIPLGALSDALGTADAGWVAAPLAQLRLDAVDDRRAAATLGVAVTADDLIAIVAPNLAAYFTARLAAGDSDFAADADLDGDRVVTPDELIASDTAQVLLAPDLEPDLDLPRGGASLGFRFAAEAPSE
jgi:hypothetical protein